MATWCWDSHVYIDILSHVGVRPDMHDRRNYIVKFDIISIPLEISTAL